MSLEHIIKRTALSILLFATPTLMNDLDVHVHHMIRKDFDKTEINAYISGVYNSVKYDNTVQHDIQTPIETAVRLKGNCADKTLLLYEVLKRRGYEPKLVYGIIKDGRPGHLWNKIVDYNTGKRIYLK